MLKTIFVGSAFMEMLYKYYSNESKYAFENIEEEVICFTPIESLNDPFEGISEYTYQITPEEKEYWNLVSKNTPDLLSKQMSDDIHDLVNFNYRIFSSSKDYDNPLLWAHYANSHKGFCIGYNKSDIENLSYKVSDINYSKKIPTFDEIKEETFEELLYTKSDEWKYENECRALYKLKSKDVEHLPPEIYYNKQEHSNNYIYIIHGNFKMPICETLSSLKYFCCKCKPVIIYLGMQIKEEDRNRLIKIADKLNIEVYQMTKRQHSFDLFPQRIEPELINFILQTSQTSN